MLLPRKALPEGRHRTHTQSGEGEKVRPAGPVQAINKCHHSVISHLGKFLPIKRGKDLEITKPYHEDLSQAHGIHSTGNPVVGRSL